jgi:hypothetical protein
LVGADSKGVPEFQPVYPFNVYFVQNYVKNLNNSTGKPDRFDPCEDIYKAPGCRAVEFATLTTTSPFVASSFGDFSFFSSIRDTPRKIGFE